MRLVPTKVLLYLFINYNTIIFKERPLCLHTPFPAVLSLFVAFLEHSLWDVVEGLRSGLLAVLLFEIKRSRMVRDQVRNEAAASP